MARGTTLGEILDDLRAEVGHSLNPALGVNTRDVLINVLRRQQKRLWEDYDWPFLRVDRDIQVQAGQRYYNLPSDLVFERLSKLQFKYGDRWMPMTYGIGREQLNQFDSDRDIRSWPVERWDVAENNQVEIWPIPTNNGDLTSTDGTIRFTGIRRLNSFVADSDTADLDDQLITLYAAAEILARQKASDAQNKLAQAQQHYARLKARTAKGDVFVMGYEEPDVFKPRDPPMVARVV